MSKWTDPRASLYATTLTSGGETGDVIDLLGVKSTHAVQYQVDATSTVGTLSIALQGSFDNANWYDMDAAFPDPGLGAGLWIWPVITSTSPAAYLRVVGSAGSGTVSVTAYVSSRD